jgi:hypothetical protein
VSDPREDFKRSFAEFLEQSALERRNAAELASVKARLQQVQSELASLQAQLRAELEHQAQTERGGQ